MAWTAPRSWSDGEVPTGSVMNTHVRDELLELAPGKVTTAGDLVVATGASALARKAAGSAGQQVVPSGSTIAFADADDPWWVEVDPLPGGESNTNWNTLTGGVSTMFNATLTSSGAVNAEVNFTVLLAPGTWTFRLHHYKGTNRGISSVQLDGVEIGTIDGYSASTVEAVSDIAGVVVAAPYKKTLKLKITGKNASSSNYFGLIQKLVWFRTA